MAARNVIEPAFSLSRCPKIRSRRIGSVHRPGRRFVCELGDRIPDPAPDRYAVVIVGGCQLIGARFAFLERLLAIALEHQVGGAPDIDLGYHAAKTARRPAFDRLLKAVVRREIDLVAAWSVDRLGRSLQDLVGFLGELKGAGVDLYLNRQAVDTTTPAGKALFQMLGVFAEFERSIIQERIHAGIARARPPRDEEW
jgi:hypothetical protein